MPNGRMAEGFTDDGPYAINDKVPVHEHVKPDTPLIPIRARQERDDRSGWPCDGSSFCIDQWSLEWGGVSGNVVAFTYQPSNDQHTWNC